MVLLAGENTAGYEGALHVIIPPVPDSLAWMATETEQQGGLSLVLTFGLDESDERSVKARRLR